jgi:hypothetical protein
LADPAYDLSKIGCEQATDADLAAAQSSLAIPGTLRNASTAPGADGYSFLTAELWRRGHSEAQKGDLLTFASRSGEKMLLAVDVNARADTSLPHAPFGVATRGARESRACADVRRGTTRAQASCQAQEGGPLTPGAKKCS